MHLSDIFNEKLIYECFIKSKNRLFCLFENYFKYRFIKNRYFSEKFLSKFVQNQWSHMFLLAIFDEQSKYVGLFT